MTKITNKSRITSNYTLPDLTVKQNEVESNVSYTEYMTASFTKIKEVSKTFVEPDGEITQTLTLTNDSEYDIFDITITDVISEGGHFKTGSVEIDGVSKPNLDPIQGITLENDLTKNGGETVIKYTLIANSSSTVDVINLISNITYSVNEVDNLQEQSNSVSVDIIKENILVEIESDKSAVIAGDTLTFQSVITNNGSIKNTEVYFYNSMPIEVDFIANSVQINDVVQEGLNPETGFKLDDLDPGAQIKVKFNVKVK